MITHMQVKTELSQYQKNGGPTKRPKTDSAESELAILHAKAKTSAQIEIERERQRNKDGAKQATNQNRTNHMNKVISRQHPNGGHPGQGSSMVSFSSPIMFASTRLTYMDSHCVAMAVTSHNVVVGKGIHITISYMSGCVSRGTRAEKIPGSVFHHELVPHKFNRIEPGRSKGGSKTRKTPQWSYIQSSRPRFSP
jgi:hypothetical protein